MNEKEFNLQVLAKLVEIANVIFAKLTINIEGTFTAAELWEGKNSLNENIVIDYHGTQFDTYTVEVGTFKCSFTPEKVFYLVWKFEQLCHICQEKKARFTYGVAEHEIINGKAMYLGKAGKVMKRKKTLVRLSEHVAYEPCKQSDSVDMYCFAGGIWYYVQRAHNESQLDRMATKLENDTEWLKNTLNGMDYTQDIAINTIYKALRNVLCAEVIKDTSKERKCENKAKNEVICDVVTRSNNCNSLHVEQREVKAKIVSMIGAGGICTESAKILYEKLTGKEFGKIGKTEPVHEEASEDYPPEPYNKTGEASGETPERKAIRTTFSWQKVFPTELYYARRKIRRFKRLSFAGYTNYHSREESAANQTGSGKSGGYSVVAIRGSAKKGKLILTRRKTCFRAFALFKKLSSESKLQVDD